MHDSDSTGAFQSDSSQECDNFVAEQPHHIGRYRVERILGRGGFGLVYLAHDQQLQRLVAIKVPHSRRVSTTNEAKAYLTEARTVASLDHPHIVPVFDIGCTEEFPCFIVSKYIDGMDLASRLKQSRLSLHEAVELVATVADALHYAHRKGLVHRDIKSGNILIDTSGKPYVVDFGLALREQDISKKPHYAGTPAYMSPEQARGEGHRVDGRSDIFSLGVVFYELLAARQPFRADSQAELLEQVANHEPRPLRQVDESIPKELERICFKAMAKRSSERYMTGKDMADDLRHFLLQQPTPNNTGTGASAVTPVWQAPATSITPSRFAAVAATPTSPTSDHQVLKIVPKGLRSFDAHDADFFLELLPGPRDREGLPDSIRFWKTHIEEADADNTFAVGLIYGPSGCGKSSLVKAGLLPRLSHNVIAVYVEATAEETETRLLYSLRKRCTALSDKQGLKETLAALRRGQGLPLGKKVVIVLDQFEQWLHAKKEEQNTDLVQALRQCDGGRVQCIAMVRDDFWMAATRFMRELDIRLLEGQNSAAVDLFPIRHAEKVLVAFGRAFGLLPDPSTDFSKDQKQFLGQAVAGLAQESKVISVRLALFAEMMKGKAWTPSTLKEVGGTEGVGITFLEETFSAATAPPEHRYHQKAARGILRALLPESGTDIKGHMRSYQELLEASGYKNRPKDFDDLIRILDGEIRLITPTDPEGKEDLADSLSQAQSGHKYYQLTHDYLVPSLRDWLTRKQKETRRGRAELLLTDRAAVWNTRPENRQLPSFRQWLSIRWLTAKKNWTALQRKMMVRAARYHGMRAMALGLLLAVITVTGLAIGQQVEEQRKATHAAGIVQSLLNAETAQVPGVVAEMSGYRRWTDPLLREESDRSAANSRQKLHTSIALLPVDDTQVGYLFGRLLDAEPHEVPTIRDALAPHKDQLLDKLWMVVESPQEGKESQRLRAAAALAKYDTESEKWAKVSGRVVDQLTAENPVFLGLWMEDYRPIKGKLLASLANIYRDSKRRESERLLATNILADFAADQAQVLAELLMDGDEKQFAAIYPKFKDHGQQGTLVLNAELDQHLPSDAKDDAKEKLAKRQANAAVALLRMNQPTGVWSLLKHSSDPRARSYLIHRLSPLGADAKAIIKRLDDEPEQTIRRALILSLGEFDEKAFSLRDRESVLPKLQEMYCTDTDPGLHAAAEWLLRQWDQKAWLKQENERWAKDREQREKRLEDIKLTFENKEKRLPQWYVNGQGQTMVVIPGPVDFLMGSPPMEMDRQPDEPRHKRRIGQTFAIAAKAVTVEQYRQFDKLHTLPEMYARMGDLPAGGISWSKAAKYCNWLSREEGIREDQWCYEIKGDEIKLKEKYLSLLGYRLPTEAEMEYASRAGAVTSRYFGETQDLLPKYAWYLNNSQEKTWPVGSLKPNDLGLFDALGNVYTWCLGTYKPYPTMKGGEATEDREDELAIVNTHERALRSGAFNTLPAYVRSADRLNVVPTTYTYWFGIRPARTFIP